MLVSKLYVRFEVLTFRGTNSDPDINTNYGLIFPFKSIYILNAHLAQSRQVCGGPVYWPDDTKYCSVLLLHELLLF